MWAADFERLAIQHAVVDATDVGNDRISPGGPYVRVCAEVATALRNGRSTRSKQGDIREVERLHLAMILKVPSQKIMAVPDRSNDGWWAGHPRRIL